MGSPVQMMLANSGVTGTSQDDLCAQAKSDREREALGCPPPAGATPPTQPTPAPTPEATPTPPPPDVLSVAKRKVELGLESTLTQEEKDALAAEAAAAAATPPPAEGGGGFMSAISDMLSGVFGK